ncbi:MAG: HAD family hydrolase [Anaerolineaceae bacterium]|nr:HAD family hydrolase [Anaerolineaceae bacterium]
MTQQTTTNSIQVIAVDLDGTLLNSQHQVSERTEKALKAAIAKGVQVILATGKTAASGRKLTDKLGLKLPGIYTQGTVIYDAEGTLLHQQTFSPALARQVITFAEDRGYNIVLYCGNRLLVRTITGWIATLNSKYGEPVPEVVNGLQNVLDSVPVNKLLAVTDNDPRRVKALRWQLSMQVDGAARMMDSGITGVLEILPPAVSKATALKTMLKDMKVPTSAVMAIGDAENDVEMLQLAGIGVAVGNAAAVVKDVADYVVASNDADGVAEAIERFVLAAEQSPAEKIEVASESKS